MKKRCLTCCIILLIIALLLGGAVGFSLLHTPKPATIVKKLTNQGLQAMYAGEDEEEILGEEGLQLPAYAALVTYSELYPEVTFTGIIMFLSSDEEEIPNVYGILLFTDSIKSAVKIAVDFYKESDEQDFNEDFHTSTRGKAVFLGNMKAEIAFRKIIF